MGVDDSMKQLNKEQIFNAWLLIFNMFIDRLYLEEDEFFTIGECVIVYKYQIEEILFKKGMI